MSGAERMQNGVYGYIRVSSMDQNEERQLIAMREKKYRKKTKFCNRRIIFKKYKVSKMKQGNYSKHSDKWRKRLYHFTREAHTQLPQHH